MKWEQFEWIFSGPRVSRYRARCHGDEGFAMVAYRQNVLLSEALTPVLGTVEVVLRNAVHRQLTRRYGRADWWEAWRGDARFRQQLSDVRDVCARLRRRKEAATPDKVVAELTFGFWATLFNAEYQGELWGPLRMAFPHCHKAMRKRAVISAIINRLRLLRNRTFHHEPILWKQYDAEGIHHEGLQLLHWMNGELHPWLETMNRVPSTWRAWEEMVSTFHRKSAEDAVRAMAAEKIKREVEK